MPLTGLQDVRTDVHETQQYLSEQAIYMPSHLLSALLHSLNRLEQELTLTQEFFFAVPDRALGY